MEEALQNITIAFRDHEVIDDEGNIRIDQESLLAIKANSQNCLHLFAERLQSLKFGEED